MHKKMISRQGKIWEEFLYPLSTRKIVIGLTRVNTIEVMILMLGFGGFPNGLGPTNS